MSKKVILIIMDGWGLGTVTTSDAIKAANTPFIDELYKKYPNATLVTHGNDVGLPEGQMGNSEVGHLNLGAGRIVYQELERINVAIKTKELNNNKALLNAIHYAKTNNKKLHLIGLLSNGGVHSHINHLKALIDICKEQEFTNVFIHAITDGRDCDPKSGISFIEEIQSFIKNSPITLASVCGRYYAMDRDKRWERIKLAYDLYVHGVGEQTHNIIDTIKNNYENNVTDEFLKPIVVNKTTIENDDAVLFFNFRTDRCREIVTVLTQQNFDEHQMKILSLHVTTMTEYDANFKNVNVMFTNDNLTDTIGEVLEKNNKTQVRIAETEKYPHVTFFFSGGREKEFIGESRILKPSPKVATYDLQPEMSAYEICSATLELLDKQLPDFICINFANADMVGHTGVFSAAIKAAETVDNCVQQIVESALNKDYTIVLTADHGNSDYMINEDGTPNTAHTTNPVPLFIISNNFNGKVENGKLGDIAPTILKIMDIPIPPAMTGKILI